MRVSVAMLLLVASLAGCQHSVDLRRKLVDGQVVTIRPNDENQIRAIALQRLIDGWTKQPGITEYNIAIDGGGDAPATIVSKLSTNGRPIRGMSTWAPNPGHVKLVIHQLRWVRADQVRIDAEEAWGYMFDRRRSIMLADQENGWQIINDRAQTR